MAEVIVFNRELNDAERIIIDNYLAAKYEVNIPSSNDYYAYDNTVYDENLFGIGRSGDDYHVRAQGGNLTLSADSTELIDQDFIIIGSNNKNGQNITCAQTDEFSKTTERIWRIDNRNGNVTTPPTTDDGIEHFTLKFRVGSFNGQNLTYTTADIKLRVSDDPNFAETNVTSVAPDEIVGTAGEQHAVFNLSSSQINRGDYLKFEFGQPIIYENNSFVNGSGNTGQPTSADSGRKLIVKNGTAILNNNTSLLCIEVKDGAKLNIGEPSSDAFPTATINGSIRLSETGELDATFGNLTFSGSKQQLIRDIDATNVNDTVQLTVNNLTLGSAKSDGLELRTKVDLLGVLRINGGKLITNGNLTFKSSEVKTAVLAKIDLSNVEDAGILGDVTVERFIPAKRAFRFISSSVDTDGTINENWQEGVHNIAISGNDFNKNPNPGFGTHITGSQAGNNGFDATPSGNPSLFTFDNSASQGQQWNPVPNTDQLTLDAGKPYRLFVRGSRGVDVTNNETTPIDTRLRMMGELKIGEMTYTNLQSQDNAFSFLGNPYQAQVDMGQVLSTNNANNVNSSNYYIYDPTLNTRGAYVSVAVDGGAPTGDSDANQFLQPNQGFFVQTTTDGDTPSVTFEEGFKVDSIKTTDVFSLNNAPRMNVKLYKETFEKAVDGVILKFNEAYSNEVTDGDFGKLANLDENIAIKNATKFLSAEQREMPEEGDVIQLYNDQYRAENYSLNVTMENLDASSAVLVDNYLTTETDIENGELNYSFMVDQNEEGSIASDRFSIVFGNTSLGIGEEKADEFALYPNPTKNGQFNISLNNKVQGKDATVEVYNIQGQRVFQNTYQNVGNSISVQTENLASGVYLTKVKVGGQDFERKLIVE